MLNKSVELCADLFLEQRILAVNELELQQSTDQRQQKSAGQCGSDESNEGIPNAEHNRKLSRRLDELRRQLYLDLQARNAAHHHAHSASPLDRKI